jgi:hypothetical protein
MPHIQNLVSLAFLFQLSGVACWSENVLVPSSDASTDIKGTNLATPIGTSMAMSVRFCKKYNTKVYEDWEKARVRRDFLTTAEITEIFQTIASFGETTLYTPPNDGIPRLHFLGRPTRSETRNVTAIQTLRRLYDPDWKEKEEKMWDRVPCDSSDPEYLPRDRYVRWGRDAPKTPCPAASLSYFGSLANKKLGSTMPSESSEGQNCIIRDICKFHFDEEILLIYWPPTVNRENSSTSPYHSNGAGTVQRFLNATTSESLVTFSTSSLTFKGRDLYHLAFIDTQYSKTITSTISYIPSSVLPGPFIFTSPTLYIAHKPIKARIERNFFLSTTTGQNALFVKDYWNPVLRKASVFPIQHSDVFTLAPKLGSGIEYARKVAQGEFQPSLSEAVRELLTEAGLATSQSFDFHDLEYPLPASLYFNARAADCWGKQAHCQTITEDNYRPEIGLRLEIWLSIFKDFTREIPNTTVNCAIPHLVDPPIALRTLSLTDLPAADLLPTQISGPPAITPPSSPNIGLFVPLPAPGPVPPAAYPRPTPHPRPTPYRDSPGPGRPQPGRGGQPTGAAGDINGNYGEILDTLFSPYGRWKGGDRYFKDLDPAGGDHPRNDGLNDGYYGGGRGSDTRGSRTNPSLFTSGSINRRLHKKLSVLISGLCLASLIMF